MSVLVTGSSGFIGRHVVDALRVRGYNCVLSDLATGEPIEDWPEWDERVVSGIRAVIHLASPVGTYGVVEQAGDVAARILSATHAAIELCRHNACPLVNVSTSEVYGAAGVQHERMPIAVPARHSPRLAYAVGKLAAEMDVHTSGIDALTIRPYNVAGPGQNPALGFVVPRFVDQVQHGQPITVFGDGLLERAFAHVVDVAEFIVQSMEGIASMAGEVVNVGNPSNRTTIRELAFRVASHASRHGFAATIEHVDGKSVFGAQWEEAAGATKLPDDRLARSYGWRPTRDLDMIVNDVWHDRLGARRLASSATDD